MTVCKTFVLSCAVAASLATAVYAQGAGPRAPALAAAPAAHLGLGVVKDVDPRARSLTISHQAIASMGMPPMTMSFSVAPSVDISTVKPGHSVAFVLSSAAAGGLTISSLQTLSGDAQVSQASPGTMQGMPHARGHMMMNQCHEMMMNRK